MTMPPLLLGASLLFWGWQTGMLPVGVIAALLVEAPRLVRFRIHLEPVDFRRITDFNSLLLAALLVYVFLSNQSTPFIFIFLQWAPIALLPMILAQLYSTAGKIDPGAIFWSLRKSGRGRRPGHGGHGLALSIPCRGHPRGRLRQHEDSLVLRGGPGPFCRLALAASQPPAFPGPVVRAAGTGGAGLASEATSGSTGCSFTWPMPCRSGSQARGTG